MKKILLIIIILGVLSTVLVATPLAKGQKQFNAGVGLSSWGAPVFLGFDYGFHQDVTFGGELSFQSYREKDDGIKYNHSIVGISGNANYHFNTILELPSEWDLYAGLSLGFFFWNSPSKYHGSHDSGLGITGQVGGRYYFNERFGINLQLGGGNAFSGGKIGITMKL